MFNSRNQTSAGINLLTITGFEKLQNLFKASQLKLLLIFWIAPSS